MGLIQDNDVAGKRIVVKTAGKSVLVKRKLSALTAGSQDRRICVCSGPEQGSRRANVLNKGERRVCQ